ncbi:MAG: DUF882 domain-containing protein [Verrucomicrobia bacterium]|nr:DUF882 domain-containing protein [Verrucomicrobiota bacterium]
MTLELAAIIFLVLSLCVSAPLRLCVEFLAKMLFWIKCTLLFNAETQRRRDAENIQQQFLFLFFLLASCQNSEQSTSSSHTRCDPIDRLHTDHGLHLPAIKPATQQPYPWQTEGVGQLRAIQKDYFRCKGSNLHPPHIVLQDGKETGRFYDCAGAEKHSLPVVNGKEFIYPILLELLSEIQKQTGLPVIITSGHRCPAHNAYLDPRIKAQSSKHMIGAEVDFYVQDMQETPEKVIQIIFNFYNSQARYQGKKEYQTFSRFEKETDVVVAPWLNKEIFIKLHSKTEGRNFDNRHPYPYISIQVRFDREKNERVVFTPQQAQQFLRK